jgi:hypothetical protein
VFAGLFALFGVLVAIGSILNAFGIHPPPSPPREEPKMEQVSVATILRDHAFMTEPGSATYDWYGRGWYLLDERLRTIYLSSATEQNERT